MSRPAIFLDRDGVLVEEIFYPRTGEREAPLAPEDVRLLPGVAPALRHLAAADYALVVISNQAGYAKGKASLRALWLAHERFVALLAEQDAKLDGCYYSYGHPDGIVPHFSGPSLDRKPGPYNVFIAAAQLDLDRQGSWMVGDRQTDVACAHAAGLRPILITSCGKASGHDGDLIRAPDLPSAAEIILKGRSRAA
ncbi:MAG: HAD-IIIA family hydrolase [Bradyrhizobium sp.]|nr:HAD-IIIA family hydrolase [Bradyrhizobium sp.]